MCQRVRNICSIGVSSIGQRNKNYCANKIKEVNGDTKKLWYKLNKITNKVHNKNAINVLKCNGTNITVGKTICNIINEKFGPVSTKIASMLRKIGNPLSYLKKKGTAVLMLNSITEIEMSKSVEKLPNKTSMGHNEISNIPVKSFLYY